MSPLLQEQHWCHRHWSPLQGTVPRLLPMWDDYPKLTEKCSNVVFFSLQNLLERLESRYQLSTWISVSQVMKPEHCWQRTENQSLRSIDLRHNACGDIGAPLGEALRWSDVDVFLPANTTIGAMWRNSSDFTVPSLEELSISKEKHHKTIYKYIQHPYYSVCLLCFFGWCYMSIPWWGIAESNPGIYATCSWALPRSRRLQIGSWARTWNTWISEVNHVNKPVDSWPEWVILGS